VKKAISLVLLLALSACGTTAQQRLDRGPNAVMQSDKSPVAIAECVVRKEVSIFVPSPLADGGYRVSNIVGKQFTSFIEIHPKGEGSEVRFYTPRGRTGMTTGCI